MTFKQKNTTVTLVSFTLILAFIILHVYDLMQSGTLTERNIFTMWGVVIVLATVVTVLGMLLTHAVPFIAYVIRSGDYSADIDQLEDERDNLIDLRGTSVTYTLSSIGSFVAMATFALGFPPLVMFTLLIFFGVLAQVIGDATRLVLYWRQQ
jgi:hypothetical protein